MNQLLMDEINDVFTVADRVWGRKEVFVNFYIIQDRNSGAWALVDAGLRRSASKIKKMVVDLFGKQSKPSAIILTHGHFDHVGALSALLEEWTVPVYAHEMELPYLTGMSSYPPADPLAGGGMISLMSFMYPTEPINISDRVQKLPSDGSIPDFPEWKFIPTPGHSPGHISLFRASDKILIAGDAFVTTKAESAFYAFTFKEHLSGPPKYFTCDWEAARLSILKILELSPNVVATGHGKPMQGVDMRDQLENLEEHFNELAKPAHGRYVNKPAITNKYGLASWPQRPPQVPALVSAFAISALVFSTTCLFYNFFKYKKW